VASSFFLVVALIAVLMAPGIEDQLPGLGALSYVAGGGFAVLLYATVLLHELSHAFAARAFDMPVRVINLHFLGGATEIEGESATAWREFVIAVVGPLTSLAVGAAAFAVLGLLDDGLTRLAVAFIAGANLLVGALNLVPGLPLDGGRVLQAAVWGVTKKRALGTTVAAWGGRVAAVSAFAWPFLMPLFGLEPTIINFVFAGLVGAFLWTGASQALTVARLRTKLPALRARQLARPAIAVSADLPLAEGVRRAQEARAGGLVVVTSSGVPTGIVNEAAVLSTPPERRPWLPCGDLARRLEDGLMLPADLYGEELLRAMNRTPATEYVLMEPNGGVYGVLVTADVDAAFKAA
jgi:Zn-dependent protease